MNFISDNSILVFLSRLWMTIDANHGLGELKWKYSYGVKLRPKC